MRNRFHCSISFFSLFIALAMAVLPGQSGAQDDDDSLGLKGLEWRLIGPWRGGRVTTVTGVPGQPMRYYMGATGGGVWKTENAGTTWENISDKYFNVGTIGAIAVAASDDNVLYAGTGESPIRGVTTSHGDGVYKSTDAGKTWKHVGLKESGQISRIRIHPENPDIAYVAVQGQIWGPNEERGVYRTSDGGETWEQVLKVSENTGAGDLSMDPANPRVLYAAMWNHGRKPWFIHSGGTDGGIFKTVDGGDSWEKLEGGLPELIGKVGVDVSASNPSRVYAIIEAEYGKGGLWRSDDAGKSWALINNHRVLHSRAWYYNHIKADPVNEDTVYVLNVPLLKSIDGGKNWERVATPHGDHHDHWINPEDNRNMINGNDGGATVTFDGGKTWSSIMNQPTAQFYRVVTDKQVPYRIYGGQQDNSTVAIASRSLRGGIGVEDYYPVGGGESAHIAFDPDKPDVVYATTINGTLTRYDHATGRTRSIKPYPEVVWGQDSRDLKYRANWNSPVAMSPHDSSIIYYGAQVLLKSTDQGLTWTEISPDLTRNDPDKQGRNGGPLTPENVGAEFYNTIFYIVESPHEQNLIWVGADDGMVHVTRDGGENWTDVSPDHGSEAMINAIEISPHDPGTVYLAVTGYKMNDFKPYIYKTRDYGRRWTRIDEGLPEDTFVRVVREDPAQQGVLYAGTEAGMFVSFNDGGDWHSLQLNLPPVPVTDLSIRADNLVAATQGRSFWVMDDLYMVRNFAAGPGDEPLSVFAPESIPMIPSGGSAGQFEGANPPAGVTLYYYLQEKPDQPLSIAILDANGAVIRSYFSEESDYDRCKDGNMDERSRREQKYPETGKGLNKWTWDMKREGLTCIDNIAQYSGFGGASVLPGEYSARISIDDLRKEVSFSLTADPMQEASEEEIRFWSARLDELTALLNEVLGSLGEARKASQQIEALMADDAGDAQIQELGAAAIGSIIAWDEQINQALHQTYEDEDAWEVKLAGQIGYLLRDIDRTGAPVTEGAMLRLADLKAEWSERQTELQNIRTEFIDPINDWAREQGVPHVAIPGS